MDPRKLEYYEYEFLDLTDIDENERKHLKHTLFSQGTPDFLQLPWTNHNIVEEEWSKEQDQYDEPQHVPNGPLDVAGSVSPTMVAPSRTTMPSVVQHMPAVTMYSQHAPPPYTMPPSTGYQHPQNVFVSNVSNMHTYMTGHYVQPHYAPMPPEPPQPQPQPPPPEMAAAGRGHRGRSRGRGGGGGANKRNEARMDPTGIVETSSAPAFNQHHQHQQHQHQQHQQHQHQHQQHPHQFVPIHAYHPAAAYYPQTVGSHMPHPSAQHATGSPLYITPMYPPHMYSTYPHPSAQYFPPPNAHVTPVIEEQQQQQPPPPQLQQPPLEIEENEPEQEQLYPQQPQQQMINENDPHYNIHNCNVNVNVNVNDESCENTSTVIVNSMEQNFPEDNMYSVNTNMNTNTNTNTSNSSNSNNVITGDVIDQVQVHDFNENVKLVTEPITINNIKTESVVIKSEPIVVDVVVSESAVINKTQTVTAAAASVVNVPVSVPVPVPVSVPVPAKIQIDNNVQQQHPPQPQQPQQDVITSASSSSAVDSDIKSVVIVRETVKRASPIMRETKVQEHGHGHGHAQTHTQSHTHLHTHGHVHVQQEQTTTNNTNTNLEHEQTTLHQDVPVQASSGAGKSWASLFNKGGGLGNSSAAAVLNTTGGAPLNNTNNTKTVGLKAQTSNNTSYPKIYDDNNKQTEKTNNETINIKNRCTSQMGEFISKYALDFRTVSLQPRGLTNRSNYCYINSILQALLACPPLYNLLVALPHHRPRRKIHVKSTTPILDAMIDFVNEFTPLSAEARLNRKEKGQRKDNIDIICGTSFEPSGIYKILNGIRTDTFIVEGRQEDAEEFFGCILNGLNDEMLELTKQFEENKHQTLSNGDIATNGETHDQDEVEWTVMGPKNKGSITRRAEFGRTPVSDIFRGQLRSRVHRMGDQITDNVQPFFTLQLDIEKPNTVYDALEQLVNKDKLEGVTCWKTNKQVEAWQQVTIEELPAVLVLHLKCFNYKLDTCSKIIKALEFPIDLKIDSKLLSIKAKYTAKQKQYKLFAVVYHDGKEASKGHYLTDAYHVGYGGWVRYDDSTVKSVQESQVLHPGGSRVPYLLYYRRSDTIGNQQQPQQQQQQQQQQQDNEDVMIIESSPEEKPDMQCDTIVDYDYDNDKTLVTTEVSLSSVAQQVDADDITVIETFSQEDLNDAITSPLESEVTEEYVLFPTGVVVDISMDSNENMEDQDFHDKDEEDEEYEDDMKNMEIVAIQSPTSSDEEMIKQGKTRKICTEALRLNIVQNLRGEQLMTDTPDSPDQEEMNIDSSPVPYYEDSEIVIIDPTMKSPEEHIATKEDFEELIDGEKRDEKIHLTEAMFSAAMHKYTASNVFTFTPKTSPPSYQQAVSSPIYSQTSNTDANNSKSNFNSKDKSSTVTMVNTPISSPNKSSVKANETVTAPVTRITVATISSPIKIVTSIVKTNDLKTTLSTTSSEIKPAATSLPMTSINSTLTESLSVLKSESLMEKVMSKKMDTTPSLSLNTHVSGLPNKIFEDECTSPDESICQDDMYSPIRKTFNVESIKLSESESETKEEPLKEVETKTEEITEVKKEIEEPEVEVETKPVITAVEHPQTETSELAKVDNEPVPENDNTPVEHQYGSGSMLTKEILMQNVASKSQEKCSIGNICVAQRDGQIETIPASFITHTDLDDNNSDLASKSVVISIPSPTPSQEQMLDNIAMQEFETRRRDGKNLPSEFESIEDVLNMIENITGEQPTVLEEKVTEADKKLEEKSISNITMSLMDHDIDSVRKPNDTFVKEVPKQTEAQPQLQQQQQQQQQPQQTLHLPQQQPQQTLHLPQQQQQQQSQQIQLREQPENEIKTTAETQPISVATTTKSVVVMPQLSPLSQPAELTTNMANVSQQLRTLLSSLHTNTVTTTTNVETFSKISVPVEKEKPAKTLTLTSTNSSISTLPTLTTTAPVATTTSQQSISTVTTSSAANVTVKPKCLPISTVVAVSSAARSSPIRTQSPITLQPQTAQQPVSTNTLVVVSSAIPIQSTIPQSQPSASNTIQTTKSSTSGIQLMPDHPKLPLITTIVTTPVISTLATSLPSTLALTTVSSFLHISTSMNQSMSTATPSLTTNTNTTSVRKSAISLNAMLQSHPAATVPQSMPGTITAASLLGISRSGFCAVNREPLTVSAGQATKNILTSSLFSSASLTSIANSTSITTLTTHKPLVSTTNLLHTQLTKAPLKRSKSIDDPSSTGHTLFIKKEELPVRSESLDDSSQVSSTNVTIKQEPMSGGCKYSSLQTPMRTEDSQNVLLKQLLQNTGCASTQAPSTSITHTAPSLPIVPSLEAQLARPVPPTPTSLLPPLLQNDTITSQPAKTATKHTTIMSRETSFVSRPPQKSPTPVVVPVSTQQQLQIDVKKCLPPSRTPSRDELLSPPTPRSIGAASHDSSAQTPPLIIKKEATTTVPYPSPIYPTNIKEEVKKEFVDESSQQSEISDQGRSDLLQTKDESTDAMDIGNDKMLQDQAMELKKIKRRQYQQKRRQNQIMSKELTVQPKKRQRKNSKLEEDYDTFIENLMIQLRQLPPMTVMEPCLGRNFNVCPVAGSGEMSKLGTKGYDNRYGELTGNYGDSMKPESSDYYVTKPYGDNDPLPEKPPASTQRLFYDQEFPPIKFDTDDDRRLELFSRDNESPDSIVSSSSPECTLLESPIQFAGLRLIKEDDDDSDSDTSKRRMSPVIPIIAPIPIRLKPSGPYLKDYADMDKENMMTKDSLNFKSRFPSSTPLKDSGNVTVTLTLTSSAAEDIMGVLRDLANILHIPAPTSYQIVERTSTPPSHKLGLYRTKGKDGKEGAPIDIQSILNGAAKFCRHCDVVILNNLIKKRISELPFLYKEPELLGDGDELYFCSSTCYMQFALMHRSPTMTQDKAAAIVDHICQDKIISKKEKLKNADSMKPSDVFEKMDVDELVNTIKQEYKDDFLNDESTELKEIKTEIPETNMTVQKSMKHPADDISISQPPAKIWKGTRYKYWNSGALQPRTKYKRPSDKELMEMMFRLGITVIPAKIPDDTRKCMYCHMTGDAVADGPARLLNFDVDKWVHLNCALWSEDVYETVNGALMNLENALQQSLSAVCVHCQQTGATIHCFKVRCSNIYHLGCAVKDGCVFYKDKTTYCSAHIQKNEKDNELTTLSVSRRVYIQRDENRQVAAVMHQSDHNNLLRVGSLIFLSVGQLLPHQLQNFHTSNYIYPIGYKIIRFYWSMRRINKRCRYICSIHDALGRPEFRVLVQETNQEDMELRDNSPRAVWNKILEPLAALRKQHNCVQLYPQFITGEDLFGLTEPAVVRVLESLPGIETLSDYRFKYGRNPLLELPLAINPSGAARSEPRLRNQFPWKRPHTQRTGSSARPVFVPTAGGAGEAACPYSKQFVHSKSSQYKKMKQEWRNNVFLARSKIQGLGLYAARDLEKHTMVIEYIGEIIRTELAETREKKYEAKNRGIYMFRLDEERVVDATLSGGLARYINHSCNPNCVAEIVEVDRDLRIIIFAKRRIARGEELAYDYKFDIEDDQHKISCMCGAPNCRKWMN